ncbi:hypothetical protein Tco_1003753 [Tanacetum coccineum]|uniref:Reverse transcriptase domain-containing protein n=1 Tax=Tanacetum coccineum TaxID=301880 RepID=A0ABQ5FA79_9ASTR
MIKSSNGDTPFSLTYETEAVIPAEIGMPTLSTTKIDMVQNYKALEINLDLLEERREQTAIYEARSKAKMEKYYNSKVRHTSFKPGDLVYHNNDASHAKDSGKHSPKWEVSYEVVDKVVTASAVTGTPEVLASPKERVRLLVGSPGASTTPIYSPGSSSTPIYFPGSLTPLRYSPRASTPQSYSSGTSRNAECSICKHLLGKITVFSTWMTFGGNTRDLGSFGEETNEISDLHQILEEILLTERGDGVASIKRRRRDLFSDGV